MLLSENLCILLLVVLVEVFFLIFVTKLDFLYSVKLFLRAFDFLDPSNGDVFIPLFEKDLILTGIVFQLYFLVQLLQKLLLDSFGGFLFLELLQPIDLSLNDFL